MSISISNFTTIMTIINFFILYFVLRHFLFKPVNSAISSRENEIVDRIKKSEEDMEKARLLKIEHENELKSAKDEGKNIVESFKSKAERLSSDIIQDAKSEAQTLMERARTETEREKEKARDEIKTQAIDLAVLLSSKALETSIDEEQHRRLIQDFIAKVGI
jgi:F-type H+-transporting ATPase subunit b